MRIGVANPTEYYIELYNEKAKNETELDEFIKNSKIHQWQRFSNSTSPCAGILVDGNYCCFWRLLRLKTLF